MTYEYGGTASFYVSGIVEVPDGVDPREYARQTRAEALEAVTHNSR